MVFCGSIGVFVKHVGYVFEHVWNQSAQFRPHQLVEKLLYASLKYSSTEWSWFTIIKHILSVLNGTWAQILLNSKLSSSRQAVLYPGTVVLLSGDQGGLSSIAPCVKKTHRGH